MRFYQTIGLQFLYVPENIEHSICSYMQNRGDIMTGYFLKGENIHHYGFKTLSPYSSMLEVILSAYLLENQYPYNCMLEENTNTLLVADDEILYEYLVDSKSSFFQESKSCKRKRINLDFNKQSSLRQILDNHNIPYIFDGDSFYFSNHSEEKIKEKIGKGFTYLLES